MNISHVLPAVKLVIPQPFNFAKGLNLLHHYHQMIIYKISHVFPANKHNFIQFSLAQVSRQTGTIYFSSKWYYLL